MNSDMQSHLIQMFSDKEIRDILDESFIDDTVDIIEEMPANVVSRILKNSTTGERKAINEILRYPKDSAGSIMTIEYVSLHKDMTVSEAFEKIRKVGVNKETIYTCYVTENRKLIGVITVKDLFMADEDDKIVDIMETHIISVDTLEDKEIVGHMFRKYDFLRYRLWIRIIDLSVSLHLTMLWTSFKMKIQRTSQKWRLLHRMRNRI